MSFSGLRIPWEVPLVKLDSSPLCLGTAAFAFEGGHRWLQRVLRVGIALVLPMYDATHPKLRKQFKGTTLFHLEGNVFLRKAP